MLIHLPQNNIKVYLASDTFGYCEVVGRSAEIYTTSVNTDNDKGEIS